MIEHRRSDGELLGWIVEFGDGFHVLDLLGRQHTKSPLIGSPQKNCWILLGSDTWLISMLSVRTVTG